MANRVDAESFRSSAVSFGRTFAVDLVLSESGLIAFEAEAPQPSPDSMAAARVRLTLHDPSGERACLARRYLNDRFGS